MILAMFGVSPVELLVVGIVALLMIALPIAVIVAVIILVRKGAGGRFQPALPAGPAKTVRAFGPADAPISGGAKWIGNELEVTADDAGTQPLFGVPLSGIDQSMIAYRFRVKTENLTSKVYPEMWCRVAGTGECFSRGLHQKVRGTNNWLSVEIPFYLKKGQLADLLKLNLVFEGPGAVRLSDIEVLATPLAVAS